MTHNFAYIFTVEVTDSDKHSSLLNEKQSSLYKCSPSI